MKKTTEVVVCGVIGTGATKAIARADAERRLTALATAPEPQVVLFRGRAVLIHRSIEGWVSRWLTTGNGTLAPTSGCTSYGEIDRYEIIGNVTLDIAQACWSISETDDEAFAAEAFPCATHPDSLGSRLKANLLSWIGFQRRYATAAAQGADDATAYRIATGSQ